MTDLPEGWEWSTTGEVAETSLGKMLDKKQATGLHPTPYLRNVNVRWGSFDLSDVATMDIAPDKLDGVAAVAGDLVVCEGGEPGRAAVWRGPDPIALQKALHRVRLAAGLTPAYVAYLFRHLAGSRQLESLFTGSTIKHLPREKIRQVRVPVAPGPEQERIVAAIEEQLSRLDAADAQCERAQRRLGSLSAKFCERVLIEAPLARLGDLAAESRYGTSNKCSYEGQGPGVLRIPNIVNETIDVTDLKFATDASAVDQGCYVRSGDVLVVRTNGSRSLIGRAAVVDEKPEDLAFASYLIRYRFDTERVEPRFVSAVLASPAYRRVLEDKAATTAGQYNLSLAKLDPIEIPVPPLRAQRGLLAERDEALASVTRTAEAIQVAQRRIASLRRSILAAAFAGKLVPQDPDDEPAAVLLERIRAERG